MYRQRLLREMKKMFGINKKEENFYGTFKDTWIKAGGLITQATARRLLNRTKGRVNQMIKEGKLQTYTIEGINYLSFAEVMQKAEKIQTKLIRDEAIKEFKKMGMDNEFGAGLIAQLDEVTHYDPNEPEE